MKLIVTLVPRCQNICFPERGRVARLQEDKLHQMRLIPADVTFVPYMSILRNCRCWRSVRAVAPFAMFFCDVEQVIQHFNKICCITRARWRSTCGAALAHGQLTEIAFNNFSSFLRYFHFKRNIWLYNTSSLT